MEKNPHESHLEVNFMCKFLVKFILGILSCIFNGHAGYYPFTIDLVYFDVELAVLEF